MCACGVVRNQPRTRTWMWALVVVDAVPPSCLGRPLGLGLSCRSSSRRPSPARVCTGDRFSAAAALFAAGAGIWVTEAAFAAHACTPERGKAAKKETILMTSRSEKKRAKRRRLERPPEGFSGAVALAFFRDAGFLQERVCHTSRAPAPASMPACRCHVVTRAQFSPPPPTRHPWHP